MCFPEPRPETRRYDLDADHPGLVHAVVEEISALEMARYRPSNWLADPVEESAEAQLGGLLQSQLLKRFESSWQACLATVGRMIKAHDAFTEAWERGLVLSREALVDAAHAETSEAGISAWVEQTLDEGDNARPAADFQREYGEAIARDRERLEAIRLRLVAITPATDPKLRLLRDLLETTTAEKIAVFATYGETIEYLGGSSETRNACIHTGSRILFPVVYPNFSHFLPQPHVLWGMSLGVCESTRLFLDFLDFLDVRQGFPQACESTPLALTRGGHADRANTENAAQHRSIQSLACDFCNLCW